MRRRLAIALGIQPPHPVVPLQIERLACARKERIANIARGADEKPIEVRVAVPHEHPRIPIEIHDCAGIDARAITNELGKMRGKRTDRALEGIRLTMRSKFAASREKL